VLEGLVLFAVLTALIRAGALKRPGLILGAFALGYGVARSICEHFREPDPQLGFLWGGLTMGTLLSIPLMLVGVALIAAALRRERHGGHDQPTVYHCSGWAAGVVGGRCRSRNTWSFASPIERGYYATRDPLGARYSSPRPRSARCSAGSSACGRPPSAGWDRAAISLVELGPGRGT
jgi:phosphatidylglycerol:prolipoprotein diacylglycerol transferase